jgi:hypothetical protein
VVSDSDEESDEDSDDESDWEESDEESESEAGGYDLDICPPGCDQVSLFLSLCWCLHFKVCALILIGKWVGTLLSGQ